MRTIFKKGLSMVVAASLVLATPIVVGAADNEFKLDSVTLKADSKTEYDNPLKGKECTGVEIEYTINLDAAAAANGWDSIFSFYNPDTNGRVSIQTHPYVCWNSDGNGGNTSFLDYKANDIAIAADEKGTDVTYKIVIDETGIKMSRNGVDLPSGVVGITDGATEAQTYADIVAFLNVAPKLYVGAGNDAVVSFWWTEVCTLKNVSIKGIGGKTTTQKPTVTAKKSTITVKNGKKSVSSVSVKAGKKVTLNVTVSPKTAKVSLNALTKAQKKICTASLKNGKLTIKGVKKGSVNLKLTVKKTSTVKASNKSIKVTVKK